MRTVVNGPRPAGEQSSVWDGTDERGARLGAGIYWVRLSAPDGYVSSLRLLRLE